MTEKEQILLEKITRILSKAHPEVEKDMKLWDAAVMLPLVETKEGLSVLFEVRSLDLKWQPGDICFPGGRREEEDVDLAATACREMEEEMGLTKEDYTLLGPLNYFYTYIGPMLFPYVGIIHHPEKIKISTDEVGEIFTVPLTKLMELEPVKGSIVLAAKPGDNFPYDVFPGYEPDWKVRKTYDLYCYCYEERKIWGMTARVLKDFLKKISAKE